MAESPEPIESLVKKEAEPQRDPIVSRSTSAILLVCTLLLIFSAGWALYDEGFGQRPWRGMQQEFVKRYTAYLKSIRSDAGKSEAEVKDSPEYQQLDENAKAALDKVKPSTFKVGFPSDYALGVDTKYQQQYRIWVDKTSDRVFVIYARCTHLGCTPDWKASENKFKCPCHGSGYDSEGINFEGPAPRPMDRAHVELNAEGQIVVDVSRLFQKPKGEVGHFDDPGAYIPL